MLPGEAVEVFKVRLMHYLHVGEKQHTTPTAVLPTSEASRGDFWSFPELLLIAPFGQFMAPLGDVTGYSTQPWHHEGRGESSALELAGGTRHCYLRWAVLGLPLLWARVKGSSLASSGYLPAARQRQLPPRAGASATRKSRLHSAHMRPLRPRAKELGKETTA